ncbi:EAL and HDOD domain-containing protein [Aromatoleum buckelii]|uniref:HDOD domain-containing protein n=1 Tax=Aromatoleum buckelii TaxID=200254 RepID=A0ABX1N3H6_9RHOO|nr:HDOD domain-containing protein [Aromatoleum buckelii]MCK0511775.1 HDOD domain-containing protein [Aromatoleum buckelii]
MLERLAGLHVALLVQPENPARAAGSETIGRARRLQGLGMRVVLDHHDPGPWLDSLLPVADAVVFRMGFCVPEEVSLFARAIARRQSGVAVWAWDVGTHDDFELARSAGCSAFSGGFVTRRDDWKGNSLSPHAARLASLLARLHHGVETQEIAQILKHDLALAYRLLRYVNAAGWGLNHHITSVEQAVVLLGREPLQRWVSMMLLGSARGVPGTGAVLEVALTRARFLELLGALRGERDPAAQLFVLGLFSLLDVALKVPIEEAIRPLKLSAAMQDAILTRRGPMAPYLELALALEEGDAQRMKSFADVLGLEPGALARLQFEALDWVQLAEA